MPLVRIRRMGDQWISCGVFFPRPPGVHRTLCPKLVHGQVMEVPDDHEILNYEHLIEVVAKPAKDEFLRPLVFDTPENALMADPSVSGVGIEAIQQHVAMVAGAVKHRRKQRAELLGEDDDKKDDREGGTEGTFEDEAGPTNAERAANAALRSVREHAREIDDDGNPVTRAGPGRPRTPRRT